MKKIIPPAFAKVAEPSHSAAHEISALTASSVSVAERSAAVLYELVPSAKTAAELVQKVASLQQLLGDFKIGTVSDNGQGKGCFDTSSFTQPRFERAFPAAPSAQQSHKRLLPTALDEMTRAWTVELKDGGARSPQINRQGE